MSPLEPDREQIEQFVNTIFRYVANEGYIPLKAFYHDQRPYNTQSVRLNGDTAFLVGCAVDWARRCANEPKPIVFCPPLAVFKSANSAKEGDLIAGPALSVELDENPREALAKLEAVIGPGTVLVKSGGQWIDPDWGEVQDKLHAHWRLAAPARGEGLAKLKRARELASRLAGGDPTSNSIVHPIRWPGSWHRKKEPRLCEIETLNPDREIDLDEALETLTRAAPAAKKFKANGYGHDSEDWGALIASILDSSALHPALVPLTMKMLRSGMSDGAVVNSTRALMDQSKAKIDDHLRWLARYNEIPRMVSSGREKIEAENVRDEPIPLFPPLPPAEIYPMAGLGPVLSAAALAIGRKVQVPLAIAAQSVLGAAALVAQAHADVLMPFGQTRPLSLYFVTVAASGDRKSSADREALWPIRKREKTLKEIYENAMKGWKVDYSAWMAEKKKIENEKSDLETRRRRLTALGHEPPPPLYPFLTAPDPTIEGLIKAWPNAPAALGIFTAEGGQFVGGHGMKQEQVLKTAAAFSELWDGMVIKRVRAMDGVSVLHGRRLSMHLMVQPDAAAKFLADPTLRDQGFLSRMLVAAPDSIAGTRLYRDTDPSDDSAIHRFGARLLSIAEAPWPLADDRNELKPRAIALSDGAKVLWRAFFDEVENELGPELKYRPVMDFGAKAAEHAARIAGVLTIIDDIAASEISAATMSNAIVLARYYLGEAVRLQQAARTDPKLLVADAVLKFLQSRTEREIRVRELMQYGPSTVRSKAAAQEALDTLQAHGSVVETCKRPYTVKLL